MTNLEKLAENPEYKAVLGYAYKNVANDLKALTGRSRFSHDIEKLSAKETDIRQLKALINTAKSFLEAPSSLKSGIDKTYSKRAKTLNKKYGTDFSKDDIKTFFESSIFEKMKNRLGSAAAVKTVGKIQKSAKKIVNDIDAARKAHKKIEIEELKDVEGLDVTKMMSPHDKRVVENLAKIYSEE